MTTAASLGRAGSPLPAVRPPTSGGAPGVTRPVQVLVPGGNRRGARAPMPQNIITSKRLVREWRTMAAMVRCYCHDRHDPDVALCPESQALLDYATARLDRCRFGPEKPTCAYCPVHCYQRDRREQMRAVMRHAGPRMLRQHPVLSLWHWLDGFRKAPRLNYGTVAISESATRERRMTKTTKQMTDECD
jgi:hypothetical protein